MSFVIVEGVDGSGKTTLASYIAKAFGATYQHVGPPRTDMSAFAEHVEYTLDAEHERTVFDRFHLGCFSYGPIWRPERDLDGIGDFRRPEWDLLEKMIRPKSLLILCDPGLKAIRMTWKERHVGEDIPEVQFPEYEKDFALVELVYQRFKLGFAYSKLDKLMYDYTLDDPVVLCAYIEASLGWSE